ncbi:MAG: hypothetical protein R3A79_27330 [Nannocystaceae bacterium]
MGKLVTGALLASLAWGAAWWLLRPPQLAEASACDERCGEGTECVDEVCVVAAAEPPAEEAPKAKGKRKRRRRKGARGSEADGDVAEEAAPTAAKPIVDDSHIPQFSNAPQALDMNGGSERLTDGQVSAAIRTLTPRFQRCIADASTGDVELRGKVKITARVVGSGKATQVSASAPAAIRDSGAIPCVRKAVFDHRFPSYDGPSMGVDMAFEVD